MYVHASLTSVKN